MDTVTIVIAIIFIVLIILLFVLTFVFKNNKRKSILNTIDRLTSLKNSIISASLITELSKASKLVNNKKIDIKENLILDLKEKIILINDFEKEMGIAIDAVFNIVFEVKGNTVVEGKNIEFKKNHIISIGLDDKVTVINAEEAKEEVEKVYVKVEHEKEGSIVSVIISGIILILSIYAYIFVITRFKSVNKTKNEFKIEFNRIIKNCKEKLVQVDNLTDSNLQNIIFVKDFEELYKISEDVFKPILYWVSPRNNEVYFTIISDDTTYRFVLKR